MALDPYDVSSLRVQYEKFRGNFRIAGQPRTIDATQDLRLRPRKLEQTLTHMFVLSNINGLCANPCFKIGAGKSGLDNR